MQEAMTTTTTNDTFLATHPPSYVSGSSLLPSVQGDEKAVKAFGVEHGAEMCKELLAAGAPGLHFYTLNLEKVCLCERTPGMLLWHAARGSRTSFLLLFCLTRCLESITYIARFVRFFFFV